MPDAAGHPVGHPGGLVGDGLTQIADLVDTDGVVLHRLLRHGSGQVVVEVVGVVVEPVQDELIPAGQIGGGVQLLPGDGGVRLPGGTDLQRFPGVPIHCHLIPLHVLVAGVGEGWGRCQPPVFGGAPGVAQKSAVQNDEVGEGGLFMMQAGQIGPQTLHRRGEGDAVPGKGQVAQIFPLCLVGGGDVAPPGVAGEELHAAGGGEGLVVRPVVPVGQKAATFGEKVGIACSSFGQLGEPGQPLIVKAEELGWAAALPALIDGGVGAEEEKGLPLHPVGVYRAVPPQGVDGAHVFLGLLIPLAQYQIFQPGHMGHPRHIHQSQSLISNGVRQEGGEGDLAHKVGKVLRQSLLGQQGVPGLLGDGRGGKAVLGLALFLPLNPQGRVSGDGLVGGDQRGEQDSLFRVGIGSIALGIVYI